MTQTIYRKWWQETAAGCPVDAKGWGKASTLKRKEKDLHKMVISHLPNILFMSNNSCIFKNQFFFFQK